MPVFLSARCQGDLSARVSECQCVTECQYNLSASATYVSVLQQCLYYLSARGVPGEYQGVPESAREYRQSGRQAGGNRGAPLEEGPKGRWALKLGPYIISHEQGTPIRIGTLI